MCYDIVYNVGKLRLVFVDGACSILYCMQCLFCKTWPIAIVSSTIVNIMMIARIL